MRRSLIFQINDLEVVVSEKRLFALAKQVCGLSIFFLQLQKAAIELHWIWNFCITACHDTELGWLL